MGRKRCTGSRYSFPISVKVDNCYKEGHCFISDAFTNEFRDVIGRSPTISTFESDVYQVHFLRTLHAGVFTTGWKEFVEGCNLKHHNRITLRFFGETFFSYNEDDQKFCQPYGSRSQKIKVEVDPIPATSNIPIVIGHIKLSHYSLSNNHQNLPISFVCSGLNLKLEHVILEIEGGNIWKCGLDNPSSRPKEARFSSGWESFCSDLQLKE